MDEAMVRRIVDLCVREIRKIPSGSGEVETGPAPAQRVGLPELLVVFTGGMKGAEAAFSELGKLRERFRITGTASDAAVRMFGESRLAALADEWIDETRAQECRVDPARFDAIVFPTLSQNTAAKAAWGIRDAFACDLFAQAMLSGRRVVAAKDPVCPGCAKGAYAGMLRTILERLVSFGVGLCIAERLAETVEGGKECVSRISESQRGETAKGKRMLVTASMVRDAVRDGKSEITLDAAAILTPLARDEARERGIRLVRAGGI